MPITVVPIAPRRLVVAPLPARPLAVLPVGRGLQGVPGPRGAPGGDSISWQQGLASAVWTVPHNLGRFPQITVTDGFGAVLCADVSYVDANTVRITHGTALTGTVHCN